MRPRRIAGYPIREDQSVASERFATDHPLREVRLNDGNRAPHWLDRALMHRRAGIDRERCGPKILDSGLFGLGIIYKAISLVRRGRHPKTFTRAVVKLSPKLHQNDWPMVALINFVAMKARFIIGASGAIIILVRIDSNERAPLRQEPFGQ